MRLPLLAALAATVVLAACGGDSDSTPQSTESSLAAVLTYFESDSPTIYAADIDQARAELDLPDDADANDLEILADTELDDPLHQLVQGVSAALPGREEFASSLVIPQVLEAIDGTKLSAAATDRRADREVSVIATDQPFDEIDAAVDDPNYAVNDLGDGLILITAPEVDADAVIGDPPGGVPESAAMIGDDGGSLIFLGDIEGLDQCLLATAITASADSTSGTIGLLVDGEADADVVDTATIEEKVGPIDLAAPTVDGSVVRIPYTAEVDPGAPSPGFQIYSQFLIFDLYDCPK